MGLLRSPGGGLVLGPGGGIVRSTPIVVTEPQPTDYRVEPTVVSFLASALPGQKIADLQFFGFTPPETVSVSEFTDEFTDEYGDPADEFAGYVVRLDSDAGGRVALAGSWQLGYSLVVGLSTSSTAGNYTIALRVGILEQTFPITVRIESPVLPEAIFSALVENADTVTSWADQEMSTGLAFAKGDVVAGNVVIAMVDGVQVPLQLSNRTSWTDGSLKFAQARWLMPAIPPGQSKQIVWRKGTGSWLSHDTPLHASPTAITTKVAIEFNFPSWRPRTSANVLGTEAGPKSFRTATMLAGANAPYIERIVSGPICSEWRVSDFAVLSSGAKDANFAAFLYIRAWGGAANNPKRIQFFFRTAYGWNTAVTAGAEGIQVDAELKVNGNSVRSAALSTPGWSAIKSWVGGFLSSAGSTGEMDWYDVASNAVVSPPKLVYRQNVEYTVAARFYPPLDTSNTAFILDRVPSTYQPGRRGGLPSGMDQGADSDVLPWATTKPLARLIAAHARGTAAQVASNHQQVLVTGLGMGALTGIGYHRTTRKLLCYLPAAKSTNQSVLGGTVHGQGRPANAASSLNVEIAGIAGSYFPSMAYPCYLATGDQHWLDLTYAEATLPPLFKSDADGLFGTTTRLKIPYGGIVWKGQVRSVAHAIRPIVNALGIGVPNDPHHVMVSDIFAHWVEITRESTAEEDSVRGGLDRTDGRRFADLKLVAGSHEPHYRTWYHTFGLHALSYGYGISENAQMRERAEFWSHHPTVLGGGWHNDNDHLQKPDPLLTDANSIIGMNGLLDTAENRRFWRYGQWQISPSACTYRADGQTLDFTGGPMPATTAMMEGMVITVTGIRAAAEPSTVIDNTKVPAGLTQGIPYYAVQPSGNTTKISLSRGGPPVTFNTGGANMVGQAFRSAVGGVHPMREPSAVPVFSNANFLQVLAALDMYQHYVAPLDGRVFLARSKLYNLKVNSAAPNGWDERGKTTVPRPTFWSVSGTGSVNQDAFDRLIFTTPGSVPLTASRRYATNEGSVYTVSFSTTATVTVSIGATQGASDILSPASVSSTFSADIVAPGSEIWLTIVRQALGTATVSGIAVANRTWVTGGPGSAIQVSETVVVLTGTGAGETFAERTFQLEPGVTYQIIFDVDAPLTYTVKEV